MLDNYSLIIKDTNQDQPNEETQRARSGSILNVEPLCTFLMESGCTALPLADVVTDQEAHWSLGVSSFIGVSLCRCN